MKKKVFENKRVKKISKSKNFFKNRSNVIGKLLLRAINIINV